MNIRRSRHTSRFLFLLLLSGIPGETTANDRCPALSEGPPQLPGEEPRHQVLEYWLAQAPSPERRLLRPKEITDLNQRIRLLEDNGVHIGRFDLFAKEIDHENLRGIQLSALSRIKQAAAKGDRVLLSGASAHRLVHRLQKRTEAATASDTLHLVVRSAALRCHPTDKGLYEAAWDRNYDYLHCSQVHPGDPFRALLKTDTYWYGWSGHTDGWLPADVLTPPLEARRFRRFLQPRHAAVLLEDNVPMWAKPNGKEILGIGRLGMIVPRKSGSRRNHWPVLIPTPEKMATAWINRGNAISAHLRPFTRKEIWTQAFRLLYQPYGWGGSGNQRDCSQLLLEVFQTTGLNLPRNSGAQALAGSWSIEIEQLSAAEKSEAIQKAAQYGLLLLYLKGHIMLYLGHDGGKPYVFHLFSGYRSPCGSGKQTKMVVNRAMVTSLELGEGSKKGSLLERLVRIVGFGPLPPKDANIDVNLPVATR